MSFAKAFPVHFFYKNDQSNSTAENAVEFDWSKPKTEKCGPRSQLSYDQNKSKQNVEYSW